MIFCVLIGVEPSVEHGQPSRNHNVKINWFHIHQRQLTVYNIPLYLDMDTHKSFSPHDRRVTDLVLCRSCGRNLLSSFRNSAIVLLPENTALLLCSTTTGIYNILVTSTMKVPEPCDRGGGGKKCLFVTKHIIEPNQPKYVLIRMRRLRAWVCETTMLGIWLLCP